MAVSLPRRCHKARSRRFNLPSLFRRRRACWMWPIASNSGGLRGADAPGHDVIGHDDKLYLRAGRSGWVRSDEPFRGRMDSAAMFLLASLRAPEPKPVVERKA